MQDFLRILVGFLVILLRYSFNQANDLIGDIFFKDYFKCDLGNWFQVKRVEIEKRFWNCDNLSERRWQI